MMSLNEARDAPKATNTPKEDEKSKRRSIFSGDGYHICQMPPGDYLVEHTPGAGHARGDVHGTLWPTRRAAMEAVLRDLQIHTSQALEEGDLYTVLSLATTTTLIISHILRGHV